MNSITFAVTITTDGHLPEADRVKDALGLLCPPDAPTFDVTVEVTNITTTKGTE